MAVDDSTLESKAEDALQAILDGGQEYTIRGRTHRRADIDKVLDALERLERRRNRAASGMFTVPRINPPT